MRQSHARFFSPEGWIIMEAAVNMNADIPFNRTVLSPEECRKILPSLTEAAWVYRYVQPNTGWTLSVATCGAPGSGKLSLGGFRIAPRDRAEALGYNNDHEALELAQGMEEKVFWSRHFHVGGALGQKNIGRIVGGKCVLLPTMGARIGEPQDFALLDFAIACLHDFEDFSGVHLTTGQDLGHGIMSDGKTPSLLYLNSRFRGSVIADTGKPTAEGNLQLMLGALSALDLPVERARIGLVGYGNIGKYLTQSLISLGARPAVMESIPARIDELRALDLTVFAATQHEEFFKQPLDLICFNANGGSLDDHTVDLICKNATVRFICGCENLIFPNPENGERLHAGGKIFCPTELCGMMGYLTAVEEYLSRIDGIPFSFEAMYEPAKKLALVGKQVTARVLATQGKLSFERAARESH